MKHILALVTTLVLTACGGGGGGSLTPAVIDTSAKDPAPAVVVESAPVGVSYPNTGAVIVPGKFGNDQTQYVVLASIRYLGGGQTEPGPLKVFKLSDTGIITDQTVAVLGGAFSVFTNVPVVADFNHDGVDDIFLPGMTDTQNLSGSMAFISRPGQSHIRVDLPDPVWTHGATAIDLNNDGHVDVLGSYGEAWLNDGKGNFTFRSHSWDSAPGFWIHGSGVCAGDFNNTGRQQVVLTDQMVDANIGPIADTVIFELGSTGLPVAQHYLPVPVLDRGKTKETSHDVTCRVADLNNDGRLDIIVLSRPLPAPGQSWSNQGQAQILLNRGNWQFEDVTDTALQGFDTNVLISYNPIIADLNGDGKLDLWFGYFDYGSGQSTQVFLNNGQGSFTRVASELLHTFSASGGVIPIPFNNKWALVYANMNAQLKTTTVYVTKPLYSF